MVTIQVEGQITAEQSLALDELANLFEIDYDVPVERKKSTLIPGKKSEFIEVVKISLMTITTLVTVVGFWMSTRPKTTITIANDGNKLTINNPTSADLEEFKDFLIDAEAQQEEIVLVVGVVDD